MTWDEFKSEVDRAIAEEGMDGSIRVAIIDLSYPEGPEDLSIGAADVNGIEWLEILAASTPETGNPRHLSPPSNQEEARRIRAELTNDLVRELESSGQLGAVLGSLLRKS